jgi:oxygen-independent coproporphyrinogen-3 oxidase
LEGRIPAYIEALCLEIRAAAARSAERLPVHTVFWGGGTPSLVPVALIRQVTATLGEVFELLPDAEMTLEANPGTLTPAYLRELRQAGFNRISYGMQSARPDELRLLERQHTVQDVIDAVKWSRQAGFANLNLDLIYSLPFQTLANWQETIEMALELAPQHFSLYSLTIDEGTPMYRWRKKGLLAEPDEDLAADMYEWAGERLERAGFEQYEISNWARRSPDGSLLACRHNLQYWLDRPYFGFGAGAHGYLGDVRMANVRGVQEYIRRVNADATAVSESWPIDEKTAMQETLMVGLRLVQTGVVRADFYERFNRTVDEVFGVEIRDLVAKGLLEDTGDSIRLTRRGRLLGNIVFMEFVGE